MSIKPKNSDTAAPKGSAWKKNVIFALVVLALAAGIFLAVPRQGQRLTGRCGFR
jgi:hypothetical protein